ncbi:hypothetical protein Droror1_Dr00016423, partial [Drosera rotundifolia]
MPPPAADHAALPLRLCSRFLFESSLNLASVMKLLGSDPRLSRDGKGRGGCGGGGGRGRGRGVVAVRVSSEGGGAGGICVGLGELEIGMESWRERKTRERVAREKASIGRERATWLVVL